VEWPARGSPGPCSARPELQRVRRARIDRIHTFKSPPDLLVAQGELVVLLPPELFQPLLLGQHHFGGQNQGLFSLVEPPNPVQPIPLSQLHRLADGPLQDARPLSALDVLLALGVQPLEQPPAHLLQHLDGVGVVVDAHEVERDLALDADDRVRERVQPLLLRREQRLLVEAERALRVLLDVGEVERLLQRLGHLGRQVVQRAGGLAGLVRVREDDCEDDWDGDSGCVSPWPDGDGLRTRSAQRPSGTDGA
jgi:hypothetical protein